MLSLKSTLLHSVLQVWVLYVLPVSTAIDSKLQLCT